MYANSRAHLVSRIMNQHGTGLAGQVRTDILTKWDAVEWTVLAASGRLADEHW
jgi:hypothetical protein